MYFCFQDLCWNEGEEEDEGISQEDILAFKSKQVDIENKRQMLRETLRQRFADFQVSKHVNTM